MIQRDYFMKMTQMLVAFMSKVLLNKEQKNYEAAEHELEEAAKSITGVDLKIISMLGVNDVVNLLKTSDLYSGKCYITAEILFELADLKNDQEKINLYKKALYLYVDAIRTNEIPDASERFSRIESIIGHLEPYLNTSDKEKIFEYYQFSKQFSKAEDILFEMIEDDADGIESKGIKFYMQLQTLTDEELEAGNLSRREVEESLEEIKIIKENKLT